MIKTRKQREIMSLILAGVARCKLYTAEEINQKVSFACSEGATRVSLRFLVAHGILVKKRVGRNVIYSPTPQAYVDFYVLPEHA
ncbi:hypothetical protein [Ancylobacter rudongensis]|uniref:Uncharacterized protein n=1 Tax=Ancylobacter rudongensis TaxID=177413 RepID=A0A1G4US37_9HYPH|nr:hypothetical protein [Ancylobacter rudongensis]SCW95619.1 hypothetical protein SAMN05660859_0067 [Ancylobacter rudongensis]